MKPVKGFNELPEKKKVLFESTYIKHLSVMSNAKRTDFTDEHIKEIIWDRNEKCIQVLFDHGASYHYTESGWH